MTDYTQWHWQCLGREMKRAYPHIVLLFPYSFRELMRTSDEGDMRCYIQRIVDNLAPHDLRRNPKLQRVAEAIQIKLSQ